MNVSPGAFKGNYPISKNMTRVGSGTLLNSEEKKYKLSVIFFHPPHTRHRIKLKCVLDKISTCCYYDDLQI